MVMRGGRGRAAGVAVRFNFRGAIVMLSFGCERETRAPLRGAKTQGAPIRDKEERSAWGLLLKRHRSRSSLSFGRRSKERAAATGLAKRRRRDEAQAASPKTTPRARVVERAKNQNPNKMALVLELTLDDLRRLGGTEEEEEENKKAAVRRGFFVSLAPPP